MAESKTAAKTTKSTKTASVKAQPRLKALYNTELKAKLKEELGLDYDEILQDREGTVVLEKKAKEDYGNV